ncbi:MAG: reverse transcriptase N-terminal domain-containing protein [Methanoregula sp.]|nr:reverse transcriptase N-terminal domain-containing protein [Methanoregula sp.]
MNVQCSTTLTSEDSTDRELAHQWNHFPWDKARRYVSRIQRRIAKAVKEGSVTRGHMKDCTKPSYPSGMSLPQHA